MRASIQRTQGADSFHDQLRVQFAGLVQLFDDRDPVFRRHLELIEDADQVLSFAPPVPVVSSAIDVLSA